MLLAEVLAISMFVCLLVLIMSGYPVALTLGGTALLFAAIGSAAGIFFWQDLGFIPTRVFGIMSNITLMAVPLFVFMGLVLERSGIAEELLKSVSVILGRLRGSLAIGVILVGALLAASTGIVGATVVTMGVLSLPTMLAQGYDRRFASGTIAAAGTLGQIIPPSIVLILLGDMMNVDVGDLFIGAIFPGLLLVLFYIIYVALVAWRRPDWIPSGNAASTANGDTQVSPVFFLKSLLAPGLLIVLVLGSILFGIASPTEAAACGAVGALVIAAIKRRLNWSMLRDVRNQTARVTAMVFLILVGAQFFGVVFRGLQGDELISHLVTTLNVHPSLILIGLMLLIFVLGFFLDFLEICFIVLPIVQPILASLGYDQLWVAVLIAVNLQTSFLTPPFGFALFYLKGVAPPEVKTQDIYRGIAPFVGIQILALIILGLFPAIVTWLPRAVFGP